MRSHVRSILSTLIAAASRLATHSLSVAISSLRAWLLLSVYPSGPQLLSANLLSPLSLVTGNQYGLAMWSDGNFHAGLGPYGYSSDGDEVTYVPGSGYYGYNNYYNYIDYGLPSAVQFYEGESLIGMAAVGCIDPTSISSGSTQQYSFCASIVQFSRSSSTVDPTVTATTVITTITGDLTIDKSQSQSTPSGVGYLVTAISGMIETTTSGQYYFQPSSTFGTFNSLKGLGSGKVKSAVASNLVYMTADGALSTVDGSGLSFVVDNGVQFIIQWNAATLQYQLVSSAVGGYPAPTNLFTSNFSLAPITLDGSGQSTPPSCNPVLTSQVYVPDPVIACGAGNTAVTFGDADPTHAAYSYELFEWYSAFANNIYFRPFYVNQPNVVLNTLLYPMLEQPGALIHMRMGVFINNGTTLGPRYVLLAQTNEIAVAAPNDALIRGNLPSPLSVPMGTYYLGVWFDASVYAAYTYVGWATVFSTQLQYSSVTASGSFPAAASTSADDMMLPIGVAGCAADGGQPPKQWAMCATFQYSSTISGALSPPTILSGVLTTSAQPYTTSFGSAYPILSANGTVNSSTKQPVAVFSLGGLSFQAPQLLYDPTTTRGGALLDSNGLQLLYRYGIQLGLRFLWEGFVAALLKLSYTPGSPVPAYQRSYIYQYSSAYYQPDNLVSSSFSVTPYTAGQPLPTCTPPSFVHPNNRISPASLPQEQCTSIGQMAVSYGDPVIFDYTNYAEGNHIPADTIYTSAFTTQQGIMVTQVGVDLLNSTSNPNDIHFRVALYNSAGVLLSQSGGTTINGIIDQQIVVAMSPVATLAAGSYFVAIMADSSLNIATSNAAQPTMTASYSSGFPTAFTASGSSGGVPLLVFGCHVASHTFCGYFQYYDQNNALSTSFVYQGLLAADGVVGTDSVFGKYMEVFMAAGHLTVYSRVSASTSSAVVDYETLTLSGAGHIYPTGSTSVDATGLTFLSSASNSIRVAYNNITSSIRDQSTAATSAGQFVLSSFNITAIAASGNAIPSCSILYEPASILTAQPAPPTCASTSYPVVLGDDFGQDYTNNAEEVYQGSGDFIITSTLTTGGNWSSISQLGFGINNNFNLVGRMRLALYSAQYSLLATTSEITFVNPVDEQLVANLLTPIVLAPNTPYTVAMWTDTSFYQSFATPYSNACEPFPYSSNGSWPNPFPTTSGYVCATVALAAFGCTTTAPPLPSTALSLSTGLSGGKVAGIVVGCVVGSNLLLLGVLFLLCGVGSGKGKLGKVNGSRSSYGQHDDSTQSSKEPSRIELGNVHSEVVE